MLSVIAHVFKHYGPQKNAVQLKVSTNQWKKGRSYKGQGSGTATIRIPHGMYSTAT